jgi:hypothetical protein
VGREPEPLEKKKRQQSRRDALREVEAKAANSCEPVGHYAQRDPFSV